MCKGVGVHHSFYSVCKGVGGLGAPTLMQVPVQVNFQLIIYLDIFLLDHKVTGSVD